MTRTSRTSWVPAPTLLPVSACPADFAVQVISQVGNYEEIFNEHIVPIGLLLEGSPNNIWTEGGLQYVPPYR